MRLFADGWKCKRGREDWGKKDKAIVEEISGKEEERTS